MRNRFLLIPLLAASITALAEDTTSKKSTGTDEYHVVRRIPIGGDGGWDYMTIDKKARRLYVARSTRISIVDLDTENLVGEIEGLNGAHGVALVPDHHRAYITSGKDNTVRVVDLKTLKELSQVATGAKPDAIVYDPASKKVFAFNHDTTTATVIDAASDKSVGEVELGGSPEFAVADEKGLMFVNLEDKNEIAVIDTAALKVIHKWPLAPGEEPTGLALDAKNHRLFAGCHNKLMMVLDSKDGHVIANLPIGGGVDAVAYDPDTRNAFSSNGEGTLTVIHEDTPDKFRVLQNVQTQAGARTMALDLKTHQVWLVSAQMKEPAPPREGQPPPRREIVPNTFNAIIVSKKDKSER
jgi:YVTN family beta-propeller protein